MDTQKRTEILDRIASWLDAWPPEEPMPAELDPALADEGAAPDLATLAAAVASTGHELKLQGKAFQELRERVESLGDRPLAPSRGSPQDGGARPQQDLDAARSAGRDEGLTDLLELHERLVRSLRETARCRDSLSAFSKLLGTRRILDGIHGGNTLILDRLDEILARSGVTSFDPAGDAFDATRMRAVGTAKTTHGVGEGCVAATVRLGFLRDDKILRPADVHIARNGGSP